MVYSDGWQTIQFHQSVGLQHLSLISECHLIKPKRSEFSLPKSFLGLPLSLLSRSSLGLASPHSVVPSLNVVSTLT